MGGVDVSFTKKLLTAVITLANGNFGPGGNSVTIAGFRMNAVINVVQGVTTGTMELAIYGLPLQLMNRLSTLGTNLNVARENKISLYAGDENNLPGALAFSGIIFNGYADGQGMPQVCFRITGRPGGGLDAVKPVEPISKSGPQEVAEMMGGLAKLMGLQFNNNGVSIKLRNPYYAGSAWSQAVRLARHANILMVVERGELSITTPGQQSQQSSGIILSPQTGMVGYPAFRQASIIVRTLYNPEIKAQGQVTVQSDLTTANGNWNVLNYISELDCLEPHGKWFQIVELVPASGGQQPA